MKQKIFGLLDKYIFIAVATIYLLGTLILNETHPFSHFPIYNQFPNYSYVFYFSDKNNNILKPSEFKTNSVAIAHIFYSTCQANNIDYGNNIESKDDLEKVGKILTDLIVKKSKVYSKPNTTICLHKIYFHYENGKIIKLDKIIYEKKPSK